MKLDILDYILLGLIIVAIFILPFYKILEKIARGDVKKIELDIFNYTMLGLTILVTFTFIFCKILEI